MEPCQPWTSARVAEQLVAAFKRLPGHPVMSRGRCPGFDEFGGGEVAPLGWPQRYLAEVRDRRIVLAWARCQATGETFAPLARGMGWSSINPERRRRIALAAIAAGLNAGRGIPGCQDGLTTSNGVPEPA